MCLFVACRYSYVRERKSDIYLTDSVALVFFRISRATLSVINILRRQVRTSQETEKQWVVLHLPEASRNSTRFVQTDKSVSSPVSE